MKSDRSSSCYGSPLFAAGQFEQDQEEERPCPCGQSDCDGSCFLANNPLHVRTSRDERFRFGGSYERKATPMREYEDPQHHFDRHMDQAATRYVEGLQRAGLTPNARPTRAVSERALREARDSYTRAVNDTYEHNLNTILSDHHQRMNQIKREGMRLRWKTCPLIALLFGFLAWYNGSQSHDVLMAMVCAATSLAFLLMLILGAIFDRPR